eukprot:5720830-Prymnesium_polylepis.1
MMTSCVGASVDIDGRDLDLFVARRSRERDARTHRVHRRDPPCSCAGRAPITDCCGERTERASRRCGHFKHRQQRKLVDHFAQGATTTCTDWVSSSDDRRSVGRISEAGGLCKRPTARASVASQMADGLRAIRNQQVQLQ